MRRHEITRQTSEHYVVSVYFVVYFKSIINIDIKK